MSDGPNRRVLLVDDTPAIHEGFRKLLVPGGTPAGFADLEAAIFGGTLPGRPAPEGRLPAPRRGSPVEDVGPGAGGPRRDAADPGFEVDSALQGAEAVELVRASLRRDRPYAVAFVDMLMPPGWDGVETITRMWRQDPRIQVVICTAHTDHSWAEVFERLDGADRLVILKKPFDGVEAYQLARTLAAKWQTAEDEAARMLQLERLVVERTAELIAANQELRADLARRRATESELRLAAGVFHTASDGIAIVDRRARVLSVNGSFTAMTGYAAGQLVGRPLAELRRGAAGAEAYRALHAAAAREGACEGEAWTRRPDGGELLTRVSVCAVRDGGGVAERYVVTFTDITELRRKDEHIRQLAFHDQLTGLPNRALLLDRLGHAITMARRDHGSLGVMMIDLDRFRVVNDSHGHDVGNELLKAVATRIRACLRESDTVARVGGDEFVILLTQGMGPGGFAGLAQRIITMLSRPVSAGGHSLPVGASIGIACYPSDASDAAGLVKHADAAMYEAKSSGRGTFRFFQADMTSKAEQRLETELELREAVDRGELELFYQPKVLMGTRELCGVEALVRWRHPRRGLVPPVEFIPLAEETGIIGDLGAWVIDEACRQSREWKLEYGELIKIGVNVSAVQLGQGDLVKQVVDACEKYRIVPADIEIELTESVLMADPEAITRVLSRLRSVGVRVAVDDFGTGYSSLAYLRRLPIDVLKIDRSFIMNVDSDPSAAEIVKTIVALARTLHLSTVAEGVEKQSHADFLTACGCFTAQGYLYSPPLAAPDFEDWLVRFRAGAAPVAS